MKLSHPNVRRIFIAVGLAALTWAWWPVISVGWLGDDFEVRRSVITRGPFGMWSGDATGFFRPLASLSAWLDEQLGGGRPPFPHLTSLAIYLCASLAVGRLARSFRADAAIAAGIFASAAVHVEPVAWLSARADLLSTLFTTLSLIAVVNTGSASLVLSLILGALALASKESAAVLPMVAVLLLWGTRRSVARSIPLFVLLGAWFLIRHRVVGAWIGGYGTSALPTEIASVVQSLSSFVGATFLGTGGDAGVLPLLCLVLAVAWAARMGNRAYVALGLAFVAACLPVAGLHADLVQGEGQRLVLFPSVFLLIALAKLVPRLHPRLGNLALLGLIAIQLPNLRSMIRPFVDATAEVELLLPTLSAVRAPPPQPVLVIPGWIGPVCSLCTGWEAAAWLGPRPNHPVPMVSAALYRSTAVGCYPSVDKHQRGVTITLPPCARWESPYGEEWDRTGVHFVILDEQILEIVGSGVVHVASSVGLTPVHMGDPGNIYER